MSFQPRRKTLVERPEKDIPALLGRIPHVGNDKDEPNQHDVAEQERPPDGTHHAARRGHGGLMRLFRRMRRCVVAGDRVDRQQQTEQKHHETADLAGPDRVALQLAGGVQSGIAREIIEGPEPREIPVLAKAKQARVSTIVVAKMR